MCHSSTLKGSLLNVTAASLLFQELLSVETALSDYLILAHEIQPNIQC